MNMREILDELRIPYMESGQHHHVGSGWIGLDCPYCTPACGAFRMGYNEASGICYCWSCGSQWIVKVLADTTGLSYHKIKQYVSKLDKVCIPDQYLTKKRGTLKLPDHSGLTEYQEKYLRMRGFDPRELERVWGIRGIQHHPKYKWRILIPITYRGEIVSFTTRSTLKTGRRYLSASPSEEILSHKELLYGEEYARNAIIVSEGPIDVWRIGLGAVCTFGTGYSKQQLLRIASYPIRAICFDREPHAQRVAKNLCDMIAPFPGKTIRIEIDSKDPGSSSKREISELRKSIFGEASKIVCNRPA